MRIFLAITVFFSALSVFSAEVPANQGGATPSPTNYQLLLNCDSRTGIGHKLVSQGHTADVAHGDLVDIAEIEQFGKLTIDGDLNIRWLTKTSENAGTDFVIFLPALTGDEGRAFCSVNFYKGYDLLKTLPGDSPKLHVMNAAMRRTEQSSYMLDVTVSEIRGKKTATSAHHIQITRNLTRTAYQIVY